MDVWNFCLDLNDPFGRGSRRSIFDNRGKRVSTEHFDPAQDLQLYRVKAAFLGYISAISQQLFFWLTGKAPDVGLRIFERRSEYYSVVLPNPLRGNDICTSNESYAGIPRGYLDAPGVLSGKVNGKVFPYNSRGITGSNTASRLAFICRLGLLPLGKVGS